MKIDSTCTITLPSGEEVTMTAKEVLKFHDDLTSFINKYWEALKEQDED